MTNLFLHCCVQIFRNLRDSGQYEDSVREFDAALVELASSPGFPKVLPMDRFVYEMFVMTIRVLMFCFVPRRALPTCDQRRSRRPPSWS